MVCRFPNLSALSLAFAFSLTSFGLSGCKKSEPVSANTPPPAAATPAESAAPAAATAPAMKEPSEPAPAASTPAAAPVQAGQGEVMLKLVWEHAGELYEVRQSNTSLFNVSAQAFRGWCEPFDAAAYAVVEKREVAKDGVFQEDPNWWARAPYGLPALSDPWLRTLSSDTWYVYKVQALAP